MKRALISVTDKSGLIPFVKGLKSKGYEIISTGGTYQMLHNEGISCLKIDEVTNFPEIFEGRVKTLHPMVHGGLLGKRDSELHIKEANEQGIEWIDMVVVNLYPFRETMNKKDTTDSEIIENIDIGGPSMIRSAAKNHLFVSVVTDINDYEMIIDSMDEQGNLSNDLRRELAAKAFRLTAQYDSWIASYLTKEVYPERLTLTYTKKEVLRYGENPHQSAALYETGEKIPYSLTQAIKLHGKELSYNNIQDANASLMILKEFLDPCVVAVKHMNPCGIGCDIDFYKAWKKAYEADPVSIFGGIIAVNQKLTKEIAKELSQLFLEVIIAPDYDMEALSILKEKKNVRILQVAMGARKPQFDIKGVEGGILIQSEDNILYESIECPTVIKPSDEDIKELLFAYRAVKHVKSNAIVITKDQMTIGIGAGQMNRVGAAKIAIEQAGAKTEQAYMASDAFFPMSDTALLAANAKIKAIIQPGGSIKDKESIDMCNQNGIAMVFVKTRHFKH
ncbi:MAG: bifunctional phosphoribosylaminoimidazolecarboxamide formyltransferase/inosine monophosphate cyclohydrolase [Tenericutes bacterium HGW-Tenericutes-2]|jgi:phosphoribosylaminoimidazolecarboxamide formyltransferase/IMP cyclohydrolase|nr:MAG: bifunctional phosphoribosylaminoimidazolecarboxamide formyltransferase/inosine monophosphate cyclohydrolase [Tenericutes bacterium HGW-Tenericutes-2]